MSQKSNVGKGAILGLLGGGALGAVVLHTKCDSFFFESGECDANEKWGAALLGAGVGGVVGIIAGVTIGGATSTERWARVPLDRLDVSILPQRPGGLALSASFAF